MTKAKALLNKKKKQQKNMGVKGGAVAKNQVQKLKAIKVNKVAKNGPTPKSGKPTPSKKENKKSAPKKTFSLKDDDKYSGNGDESIEDFNAESDGVVDADPKPKGMKMFKGLRDEGESNDDDSDEELDSEDDENSDESEEDEEEENGTGLKALLGESIADDDDDDDFVNDDESDEDDDISDEEEETENNDSKANVGMKDNENGDESEEDEDEEAEDSEESEEGEEENGPTLKALLGESIGEDDDDDDDFVNDDESDEDDDISDEEEETENNDSKGSIDTKGEEEETDEESEDDEDDIDMEGASDDDDDDDLDEEDVADNDDESDRKNEKIKKAGKNGNLKSNDSLDTSATQDKDKEDRTIYVGNVPKDAKLNDIRKLFRPCGRIETMRVRGVVAEDGKMSFKLATITKKMHPNVQTVHMYICFKDPAAAEKALEFNNKEYEGKVLRVDMAKNKGKNHDHKKSIFLGNLSWEITDDEVREHFKSCGAIHSIHVIKDRKTGRSKGFGYVNFEDEDSVSLAMELNGTKLKDREIRVKRSNPESPVKGQQKKKPQKHNNTKMNRKNMAENGKFNNTQGSKKRQREDSQSPIKAKKEKMDSSYKGQKGKNMSPVKGKKEKMESSFKGQKEKSTSPEKSKKEKMGSTFQGQKAEFKKKSKGHKMNKKNKFMAKKFKAGNKDD